MREICYSFLIWVGTILLGSILTAAIQTDFRFGTALEPAIAFSGFYGSASCVLFLVFFLWLTDKKCERSVRQKIVLSVSAVPIFVIIGFSIFTGFGELPKIIKDHLLLAALISYTVAGAICMVVGILTYSRNKPTVT